jgi:hypothetical protein
MAEWILREGPGEIDEDFASGDFGVSMSRKQFLCHERSRMGTQRFCLHFADPVWFFTK